MTKRKFYKTIVSFEVLSEDPIPDSYNPADIWREGQDGGYSIYGRPLSGEVLNAKECATALIAQGSDPGFFGIDKNGKEVERS